MKVQSPCTKALLACDPHTGWRCGERTGSTCVPGSRPVQPCVPWSGQSAVHLGCVHAVHILLAAVVARLAPGSPMSRLLAERVFSPRIAGSSRSTRRGTPVIPVRSRDIRPGEPIWKKSSDWYHVEEWWGDANSPSTLRVILHADLPAGAPCSPRGVGVTRRGSSGDLPCGTPVAPVCCEYEDPATFRLHLRGPGCCPIATGVPGANR